MKYSGKFTFAEPVTDKNRNYIADMMKGVRQNVQHGPVLRSQAMHVKHWNADGFSHISRSLKFRRYGT